MNLKLFKSTQILHFICIMYIYNFIIVNTVYANDPLNQLFQQNDNTSANNNIPTNKEVIAEFKTKTVGGNTQPTEYFGNTNTYLNRMIQCTKFKADKNDPVCQQFDYNAAFQSFVNKNFNKDKINEILNNVNFNKNDSTTDNNKSISTTNNTNNISNNTGNNISNNTDNKAISNTKKDKSINNNTNNKNINNKKNINVPTGPHINIIILLILSNILIIYMIWKMTKITNKKSLIRL